MIRITLFFILFALKVLAVNAQNLLQNGSFTAQPANQWTFFAPGTTTETTYGETSYGGLNVANIVAEIDNQANLRQANIPVTAGQTYLFSFRHSRRTGNGAAPNPAIFNVKVYDIAAVYVNQNINSVNTTWNWQCKTFYFIPQTNNLSVDFENIAATTLGSILDDITIVPLNQSITLQGESCQGGSITLSAPYFPNDPNTVYTNHVWNGPGIVNVSGNTLTINNANPAFHNGIYTCTMTLNHCLTITATYLLNIVPSIYESTVSICEGNTYNFYGRTLYTAGVYDTLIVSGNNQCDSLIRLTLQVLPLPQVNILPENQVNICEGNSAALLINNPSDEAAYQWYKNDGIISGANGVALSAFEAGSYHVTGNLNGCEDTSNTVLVVVNPNPTAQIAYVPDVKCAYDTFEFRATEDAAYKYVWEPAGNFNELGNNNAPNVKGIFKQSTVVTLTVINEYGCSDTDTGKVITKSCCEVFVPTAFTPNDDGVNDHFKPSFQPGQTILVFDIYNRFGQRVYSGTHNNIKGWNGSYSNGGAADIGTYMYQLKYSCSDGKVYSKTGDVMLLR